MTALDRNPSSKNFLSPLSFIFNIKRAPNVNFFIQSVSLPGIMLDQVETTNPFVNIPHPGDHIYYEELGIHFKVNEDLSNWLELYQWMQKTGFPENFEQHKSISDKPRMSGFWLKSDISLIIADSNKNLKFEIYFIDAFPIMLSNMQFDATQDSVNYIDAFASFKYVTYDIRRL